MSSSSDVWEPISLRPAFRLSSSAEMLGKVAVDWRSGASAPSYERSRLVAWRDSSSTATADTILHCRRSRKLVHWRPPKLMREAAPSLSPLSEVAWKVEAQSLKCEAMSWVESAADRRPTKSRRALFW
ncbi:hypothetical protein MPH_10860 [Macrophomina phaseolina MS6]|uniref:Uncharacterized protein n=1 Tax=Macrophomina phaseolina (strain MS6) TaxID=1126212 RepID=K2S5I8_MACPH|nr:hypothetical protein MPH_10860 [Macrophomina phaseolina MS6]